MSWLLHNVVADLYGPYFLGFYALAIGPVIVACCRSVRSLDRTNEMEVPQIPAKIDPYQIAYLRGGENEIVRVAVASLIQRGLLKVIEEPTGFAKTQKVDRGREPDRGELRAIEAVVLKWPGFPATAQSLFQADGIAAALTEKIGGYEQECADKNLLAPEAMKELGQKLFWIGSVIIMGLGGYKFAVALAKGHSNVFLLCFFAGVGEITLGATCMNPPRLSRLGKVYLERLKLAYFGLKDQVKSGVNQAGGSDTAADLRRVSQVPVAMNAADCLLMVGIFGVASLAGTPLSDVPTIFSQGASASGGCGGGCGAAGGGCGGGGCGGGCGGCGGCGG